LDNSSHRIHSPFEPLQFVANQTEPSPCLTENCTWFFEPGTHTAYSSTNFILAGFVLLAHAPEGKNTWESLDMMEMVGLDPRDYPNSIFATMGKLHTVGLTSPAYSLGFGKAQMWD